MTPPTPPVPPVPPVPPTSRQQPPPQRPLPLPTLTRIIATVGPASEHPDTLRKLIEAGVSVFRLNFSHGSLDAHKARLDNIRAVATELALPVAILGDLPGPKIRLADIASPGITLTAGQDALFLPAATDLPTRAHDNAPILPSRYAALAQDVRPGNRVLINDGAVRLLAVDPLPADPPQSLRARVTVGGPVTSGKGINLPDSDLSTHALSEDDMRCVEWAVAHGVDFLALSFVRHASEILDLRRFLASVCALDYDTDRSGAGSLIPIVAKIEKPQALDNLDPIVDAADAIMVARGDLGVEMDLANVPTVQKRLIARADHFGKPAIVATQVLETMIEHASPTRAEASDAANAVLDGADAVMLSAETAVGKHPVLVVETLRRIIDATEHWAAQQHPRESPPHRLIETRYRTAALAHGCWYVAHDLNAVLIVCWSQQGGAARYLSQNGFTVPIIAFSSDERETRRMALLRGVRALHCSPAPPTLADWNELADQHLLARGWASPGDPVVLVAGPPLGVKGAATSLAVHYISDPTTGFMNNR